MSSPLSIPSHPVPPAPWRTEFTAHMAGLSTNAWPLITFSTIAPHPRTGEPTPRSRTCVYRGIWADMTLDPRAVQALQEHAAGSSGDGTKSGTAINPLAFDSDMPTITTDVRMLKCPEMLTNNNVEIMAWTGPPVASTNTQWRLRGRAFLLGSPQGLEDSVERTAREGVARGMRRRKEEVDGAAEEAWTFEREVTAYFANMSPGIKASFKNAPPGAPISKPLPDDDPVALRPGSGIGGKRVSKEVSGLHDPVARRHFRVVVLRPEEVELLDYRQSGYARRELWTLVDGYEQKESRWEKTDLWP